MPKLPTGLWHFKSFKNATSWMSFKSIPTHCKFCNFFFIFCQITFISSHSNNPNWISTTVYLLWIQVLINMNVSSWTKSCSKFRENFYPNWKTCFGRVFFSLNTFQNILTSDEKKRPCLIIRTMPFMQMELNCCIIQQ